MSHRWAKRITGLAVTGVAAKAVHLTITDEWADVLSYPERQIKKFVSKAGKDQKPHVVVLGTGWGALSFLRHIDRDEMRVTVISPRSFFFYTPLLAGTATGTVGHHSIIEPIRWYCSNKLNSDGSGVNFVQAECQDILVKDKKIVCRSNNASHSSKNHAVDFSIPYDHLVIAVGAEPATFNIPGVKENTFKMKEIADSIDVQDKILRNLEKANTLLSTASGGTVDASTAAEVDRLLHWVIVGGGPTGVELVAEITDFIQTDVAKYFPNLKDKCRVTLVEATDKLLSTFDPSTSVYSRSVLERRGAVVLTNTMVTKIEEESLAIKTKRVENDVDVSVLPASLVKNACDAAGKQAVAVGEFMQDEVNAGLVVWAGGITMRPFMRKFINTQLPSDQQSSRWGVVVDGRLRVKGGEDQGLWALGDCAVVEGCAPTAQAAAQQGAYLGRLFRDNLSLFDSDKLKAKDAPPLPPSVLPFQYKHKGSLAYVGGNEGVAELKKLIWVGYPPFSKRPASEENVIAAPKNDSLNVTGKGAFAIWRSVYFSELMSMRNVCQVFFDWTKTIVFGRDISTVYRGEESTPQEKKKN